MGSQEITTVGHESRWLGKQRAGASYKFQEAHSQTPISQHMLGVVPELKNNFSTRRDLKIRQGMLTDVTEKAVQSRKLRRQWVRPSRWFPLHADLVGVFHKLVYTVRGDQRQLFC